MPLIMKKTINGQPKKIRLTGDVGSGNPVGTILPLYKKSNPIGYLYCDGSTFDQTVYPALYAYLGTNVLPDYREFALVGAEENTTDVYNASTNPNGTIHDHDVYIEGQAKDDQVQSHSHNTDFSKSNNSSTQGGLNILILNNASTEPTTGVLGARAGTTTRGKRKAVFFYIKATSGVMESNTENFINVINAERSYSTEEKFTGKYWIDGKPIYSKTFTGLTSMSTSAFTAIPDSTNNYDTLIKLEVSTTGGLLGLPQYRKTSGNAIEVSVMYTAGSLTISGINGITIEYTKTTD